MTRRRARERWESEAAMCASFIEAAHADGWVAYPEIGGFDFLLVNGDGDQVGVEAKLHPNVLVLSQALDHGRALDARIKTGPHFRAVLVPHSPHEFRVVASALRIEVFVWAPSSGEARSQARRHGVGGRLVWVNAAHRRDVQPVELPPIVPTFAAGESAPRKLSPWRVRALRLCTLLREGPVSGAVFKEHGMKAGDWVSRGYVRATGCKDGRFGIYEIRDWNGDVCPGFPDRGYEAERDLLAEAAA